MHNLAVGFEHFGRHGGSDVDTWSKISSQSVFGVRKWGFRVPELYPFVPLMLCEG